MTEATETEAKPDAGDAPSTTRPWLRRARTWAIDILVVALVIIGVSAWQSRNLLPASGEPAPPFTLRALDGSSVSLSDYAGKPIQLHFWATWCGVCAREHGALTSVNGSLGEQRALLTIAVDSGDAETIRRYAQEHDLEYTILIDDGSVAAEFQVSAFPTDYYLDADHRIVGRHVGMATRWGMRWRLARAAR